MTLRHTHKMGLSLFNRVWGGSIFVNNNIDVRFLTSLVIFCVSSNTSKFYREFRNCSGVPLASEHSLKIDGRTLSTAHKAKFSYKPQANMGSILNHDKYIAIKSNLSVGDLVLGVEPDVLLCLYAFDAEKCNIIFCS